MSKLQIAGILLLVNAIQKGIKSFLYEFEKIQKKFQDAMPSIVTLAHREIVQNHIVRLVFSQLNDSCYLSIYAFYPKELSSFSAKIQHPLHIIKLGTKNKTISTFVFKDPVAPHYITYAKNCQVPKEGHLGQFPANFCVKLIGVSGG